MSFIHPNTSSVRLPTWFIPHGAGPCFFMDWNPKDAWDKTGKFLKDLPPTLPAKPKAILMISSELPEVLGMADRIIVMREGRQVTELSRKEATQENVIAAATTGKKGI